MRPSFIPIAQAYLDARNEHDLDKTLAFLTDDIRLEAVGRGILEGKEEARRAAGWDAVLQSQVAAIDWRQDDHHVSCRLEERNEWLRLAGIPSLAYSGCRFSFHGRQISHIRTEMAEESRKEVGRVLQSVITWAAEERPADLGRLLPAGQMHYGPRAARDWLALLRAWRSRVGD